MERAGSDQGAAWAGARAHSAWAGMGMAPAGATVCMAHGTNSMLHVQAGRLRSTRRVHAPPSPLQDLAPGSRAFVTSRLPMLTVTSDAAASSGTPAPANSAQSMTDPDPADNNKARKRADNAYSIAVAAIVLACVLSALSLGVAVYALRQARTGAAAAGNCFRCVPKSARTRRRAAARVPLHALETCSCCGLCACGSRRGQCPSQHVGCMPLHALALNQLILHSQECSRPDSTTHRLTHRCRHARPVGCGGAIPLAHHQRMRMQPAAHPARRARM